MNISTVLVCLMLLLSSSHGSNEFRGGFVSYRILSETASNYNIQIVYASGWKGSPNDCLGSTGALAGTITLTSALVTTTRVNCGAPGSGGTVIGTGSAVVVSVPKGSSRVVKYSFPTPWGPFACCTAMASIPAASSISMLVNVPIQISAAMNEPPIPATLLNIDIQQGTTGSFAIVVSDKEGDLIRCRGPTTLAEGGALLLTSGNAQATGSNGCTIFIDATSKAIGEYPAGFVIEDFSPNNPGVALHTVPYQIVYVVVSSTPTNTIDATVNCTSNTMIVEIPQSEFTSGTVPAAASVTFQGQNLPACASTITGGSYVLETALNNCGTQFDTQDGTYISYVNTVTIGADSSAIITRDLAVQITVRCKYERNYVSENDKSYKASSLVNSQEENFGKFTIQLRAFDSTFTTAFSSTSMSVSLRERQYCRIDVTDNNFDTVVIVERIFASTSQSRTDSLASTHNLFINRCPNPNDNTVQMNNNNDRSQFRFSFEAFVFTSNTAGEVYVHCDIFICHQSSTDPSCNQACIGYNTQPNTNNVGRVSVSGKKRRAIEGKNELIEGEGLVDLNSPSKTYFLVVGPYSRKMDGSNEFADGRHGYEYHSFWNKENFIVMASVLFVLCIAISAVFYVKFQNQKVMNAVGRVQNSVVDMDVKSAFESSA